MRTGACHRSHCLPSCVLLMPSCLRVACQGQHALVSSPSVCGRSFGLQVVLTSLWAACRILRSRMWHRDLGLRIKDDLQRFQGDKEKHYRQWAEENSELVPRDRAIRSPSA